MDEAYLLEYEKNELAEDEKLLRQIQDGKFTVGKDKYPSDERFPKIQYPTARIPFNRTSTLDKLYAQIPFCGSLIIQLPPLPKPVFEAEFGPTSEIPKLVEFAKETGRLQFEINAPPSYYVGLDFLDPVFRELKPPYACGIPNSVFFSDNQYKKLRQGFMTLGRCGFFDWLKEQQIVRQAGKEAFINFLLRMEVSYAFLKATNNPVAEEIENLLVDDYQKAFSMIIISRNFITDPMRDMRHESCNFSQEDMHMGQELIGYSPSKLTFPYEIGKFLMTKLTYAPISLDACKELIYHYDAYDLRRVQQAFNQAILENKPDILNEESTALSEILDNIWNDKSIERKVKGIQAGIPLSMAAIGSVAAGPIGAAGGFLAGLGYSVLDKTIDLRTDSFSSALAKLAGKSYQVNIYDFKKKYSK